MSTVVILKDGIAGDKYRGIWRATSNHDGDYGATDGVLKGTKVLNHRQITIVDDAEVAAANAILGITIRPGMLRENIGVSFTPHMHGVTFSKLPPGSRMVIHNGDTPKVLTLTEENGPCRTISRPIAAEIGKTELDDQIREALRGKRGQMAMVRTFAQHKVRCGDRFTVYPPMT
jgi:MOSC domain-containing protein YiiM